MTWSADNDEEIIRGSKQNSTSDQLRTTVICPSCGHTIQLQDQRGVLQDLPAGVKFDPSDQEILQHLEAKVFCDANKLHPLIDQFIPTIDGQNGICYTHPEKLPAIYFFRSKLSREATKKIKDYHIITEVVLISNYTGVSKEGQVRHFFHRPSKAYTTGTRKRRKVHSDDDDGSETRWHKTGKTRAVSAAGNVKGYKKILVLYTNYGRQRKPDKTNWVMHQYHLGHNQEETDGELVLSKVFYQTQPRQCGSSTIKHNKPSPSNSQTFMDVYYNPSFSRDTPTPMIQNLLLHGDGSSSFIHLPSTATKGK